MMMGCLTSLRRASLVTSPFLLAPLGVELLMAMGGGHCFRIHTCPSARVAVASEKRRWSRYPSADTGMWCAVLSLARRRIANRVKMYPLTLDSLHSDTVHKHK